MEREKCIKDILFGLPFVDLIIKYDYLFIGREQLLIYHEKNITSIAILSNQRIITGSSDHKLRVWNLTYLEIKQPQFILEGHTHEVTNIIVIHNKVISNSKDNSFKLWNLDLQFCENSISDTGTLVICTRNVVIISEEKINVYTYNLDFLHTIALHTCLQFPICVSQNRLVTATNKDILLWNIDVGTSIKIGWHTQDITGLSSLSHDQICSIGYDTQLKVWTLDGQLKCVSNGHKRAILKVLALSDGRIATSGIDNTVKIWYNKKCQMTLKGHKDWTTRLIELLDGRLLTMTSSPHLFVWNLKPIKSGQIKKPDLTIKTYCRSINFICVLNDGRVITVYDKNKILIFN